MRAGLMVVTVIAGAVSCQKKDPNAWPQADIEDVRVKCPESVGDTSVCDCFAVELAKRVPYERAKKWNVTISPAWSAEVEQMEEALLTCAGDAGPAPYSAFMRKRTMDECLSTKSTPAVCECMLKVYETHIPVTQLAVVGFRTTRDADGGMNALFAPLKAELGECFLNDVDAPWTDTAQRKLETGCLAEGASRDFCRCYVAKSKELIKYVDFARASRDPDDAGASLSAKFSIAAQACVQPDDAPVKKTPKKRDRPLR